MGKATTVPANRFQWMSGKEGDSMDRRLTDKDQSQANDAGQQSNSAAEPSGPKGDDPSTAGPGPTKVKSETPENRLGHINPSAPEEANTTPGTSGEK
jgi:hypothetical protein